MANFDYLDNLEVTNTKTARYIMAPVQLLGKAVEFTVKPATQANPAYFNEFLRRNKAVTRAFATGNISVDLLEENRGQIKELFCKYIAVGWKNVVDGKGDPVGFTRETCAEFLDKLPDWIFDEMFIFCNQASNFAGSVELDIDETGND